MQTRPTSPAPDCEFEGEFHRLGLSHVAGLDEVGRGCLAGPVAAGAVVLPHSPAPELFEVVRDSKRLSAKRREEAYEVIIHYALSYAVGWVTPAEIDDIGIAPATRRAMRRALAELHPPADALLIDAVTLPSVELPQKSIIRGDSKSLSIAAASIVAKVERDRLMEKTAEDYADYGFERHKGLRNGGTPGRHPPAGSDADTSHELQTRCANPGAASRYSRRSRRDVKRRSWRRWRSKSGVCDW